MNIDEILQLVLKAAEYPDNKRQDFINTFNGYLFTRQIEAVKEVDENLAVKLSTALNDSSISDSDFDSMWEEAEANPQIKERVDKAADKAINELVDDISASATVEQKQKILESLPSAA